MADQAIPTRKPTDVSISRAKGRPTLSWVGKNPLGRVTAFPAQPIEQFRAQIPDWRAVVDGVLIDANHKGEVFNVTLADVPERKQDRVAGRYELPAPPAGAAVAIKVIDMLGEERIISLTAG